MAIIKFNKLTKNAVIPTYANPGDAGFDLYSTINVVLKKRDAITIPLGIAAEFSKNYFVSFRDKSGLAAKYSLHVLGGVVDSSYRGEWKVILVNLGRMDYKIGRGDKVAQGILQPFERAVMSDRDKLTKSKRGDGGFGSTGK
jgi:dUTP pyrophosphatase